MRQGVAQIFQKALSNLVCRYASVRLEAGILGRWKRMVVKYLTVERIDAHSTCLRI